MAVAHSLGFQCISAEREQEKAFDAYRHGEISEAMLRRVGQELRAARWQLQAEAGIELLPAGDFAWHDPLLAHSLMVGVVPDQFRPAGGQPIFDAHLAMAEKVHQLSGSADNAWKPRHWFESNGRYTTPEFCIDQSFSLSWTQLFEEVDEAKALGHNVKPVLIGPLTYLWLGQVKGESFDKLDLLERLLPVYGEILQRLAAQGVEWVQIDEPILVLELPQDWKNAFERAYNLLQRAPLKKLIATSFGGLGDNLGLAAGLPVDGLHIDLVRAPDQYPLILDRLPTYKILSLGLVDGGDTRQCDLENALNVLSHAAERLGDRLWVAPSCSLLYAPVAGALDDQLDAEPADWQAFVIQKCTEVAMLARAVDQVDGSVLLSDCAAA